MKNARGKPAKMLFFIVKYANLWGFCCRRRLGFKLPNNSIRTLKTDFLLSLSVSWMQNKIIQNTTKGKTKKIEEVIFASSE